MAAVADAATAMTIDFLRARLLSERSVSRAAKDRADQLANRVAELEEQLRSVTAQRREAERAAAEVLAILDSQGFSDAADSGSDDDACGPPEAPDHGTGGQARGEAEDALSGSELGGPPQPGGLSWKGRAASPGADRRHPHLKARQRHGHGHRRSYFYLLAADSSPKYQPGQSCRKIRRKEPRLHTEGGDAKDNAAEGLEEDQAKSDSTVCTDEKLDLDGEVDHGGRGSCGDGRVEDDGGRYAMEDVKDGEMERVLENHAALIGQYEAQENAQREWEKKFNGSRDSTSDDVDRDSKLNQNEKACEQRGRAAQIMDREVVGEETPSRDKDLSGTNSPSECLLNVSAFGLSTNAPNVSVIGKCKGSDNDFERVTAAVATLDELHSRKDELVHKIYTEIIEGGGSNRGRSASSPQKSHSSSPTAGHNEGQGDGNSDNGSSYHVNACSYEHYGTTPSPGSPLSDTPKSKVSEWSSSCFHNHIDNQIDMQPSSSDDVGGVLEALQRAKMSLREKLSRASPPRQDMLALPAPEDHYTDDDSQANDTEFSLCMSQRLSHEILALPVSGEYLSRISWPGDDAKIPVGPAGLFRLPTDSFPQNEVCSADGYGSRFSLASSRQTVFSGNPASNSMLTSSRPQYGSGFSPDPYYDLHSSMLLSMPTTRNASFIPEILRSSDDSRRGMSSGDAGMLSQYGNAYD
ncbi:uncharacterized protein LOC123446077 [Hordeum vulgare subsp. vulgare]|uniref:Predicted protein n=1 Tax=Hordeum vulgare subsp. vulgare TaxID=112509 RepID=F2DZ32_HORVV|nr:uncharacterized protein LOC123446077 [Hordeum vulgare subsp. vulgare]BAK00354.1 predicted protein [Hordeum vulgare subsp. vulgare]